MSRCISVQLRFLNSSSEPFEVKINFELMLFGNKSVSRIQNVIPVHKMIDVRRLYVNPPSVERYLESYLSRIARSVHFQQLHDDNVPDTRRDIVLSQVGKTESNPAGIAARRSQVPVDVVELLLRAAPVAQVTDGEGVVFSIGDSAVESQTAHR